MAVPKSAIRAMKTATFIVGELDLCGDWLLGVLMSSNCSEERLGGRETPATAFI